MKLKTFVTGLSLAAATALVAVPSQADVKFEGDRDAVKICKAIMEDNGKDVRRALRNAVPRHQKTHAMRFLRESFQCNGQDLETFAATEGSYEALAALGGGDVDGQVATR